MKGLISFTKSTILGGVIFLVPIVVLIFVVGKAFEVALKVAHPIAARIPVETLAGHVAANIVAGVIIVIICFAAGFLARSAAAKSLVQRAEDKFLWRTPGYGFIKGLTESLAPETPSDTMHPIMLRLDDASQLAFEVERLDDGRVVVFQPSAPDAWSGSVLIATADRVEPLPVSMLNVAQNMRTLGRGTTSLLATANESTRNKTPKASG